MKTYRFLTASNQTPTREPPTLNWKRPKKRMYQMNQHLPAAKEKMTNRIIPNDIEDNVARTSSAENVVKTLSSASR